MNDFDARIDEYTQRLVASMDIKEVRQSLYEMMLDKFKKAPRADMIELLRVVYPEVKVGGESIPDVDG